MALVLAGWIKIRGDAEDVPENLCLAFSVLMLFMLCEPRDKVTIHSLRKGYTAQGKPFYDQTGSHNYLYLTNPRRIVFFMIIGYNEETPSNSHLYLASKEGMNQSQEENAGSQPAVVGDTQVEEEFLASENTEVVDDVFCPWENGVESSVSGGGLSGSGDRELGSSSSYDASFAVSANFSAGSEGGEAACGAGCGTGCGAACGGD